MSEELLPCPFCGATDIELSASGTCSWAVCAGCGAEGPWHNSVGNNPDSARTLWNTRPALIDHLEADGGVEAKPAGWWKECEDCDGESRRCPTCEGQGKVWTDQPCTLAEAPVGLFWCGDTLAVKSEYGNNEGRIDAFIVSSGEFFWGSQPQTIASQRASLVMPIDDEYAESRLSALPVLGVGR